MLCGLVTDYGVVRTPFLLLKTGAVTPFPAVSEPPDRRRQTFAVGARDTELRGPPTRSLQRSHGDAQLRQGRLCRRGTGHVARVRGGGMQGSDRKATATGAGAVGAQQTLGSLRRRGGAGQGAGMLNRCAAHVTAGTLWSLGDEDESPGLCPLQQTRLRGGRSGEGPAGQVAAAESRCALRSMSS